MDTQWCWLYLPTKLGTSGWVIFDKYTEYIQNFVAGELQSSEMHP